MTQFATIILGLFFGLSLVLAPFFFRRVWLNPLVIFFSVWFLNFIVYEMDRFIHLYYLNLSSKTEFLFVLSFLGFFLGSMSVALWKALPKKSKPNSALPGIEYSYLSFLEKVTISLFVLVLISVLGNICC